MNKNCIYYTLYGNQKYLNLLKISLDSLSKFFSKDDIFIFTNLNVDSLKEYANIVNYNFSHGFAKPMSDRYAILNILSNKYDNILHLDTDTICINDPINIFNTIIDNKILIATENPQFNIKNKYCSFESYKNNITDKCVDNYWAGPLLTQEEKIIYQNIDSICAGVYACNKTFIKHANNIHKYISDLEDSGFKNVCGDQHGFCKYLLKNNLYNFALQEFVCHNGKKIILNNELEQAIKNNLCILHFAGGVQPSEEKLNLMKLAMEKL